MGHGDVMPWWHAYTFDNWLRRLVHRPEKLLGPYVKAGMTVLDVGCGMGHFAIGMARMVGGTGSVIAVDVQQEMLDVLRKRAERAGVAERIRMHRCEQDSLGVDDEVDFAVAFWVVHEAPDPQQLVAQISACLEPSAKLLVAEPRFIVSEPEFGETIQAARAAGLEECGRPHVSLCRAAVFVRG